MTCGNLFPKSGCPGESEHGRHYLDLVSGLWCCALGHNHPVFITGDSIYPLLVVGW
jgi:hypothetical protein